MPRHDRAHGIHHSKRQTGLANKTRTKRGGSYSKKQLRRYVEAERVISGVLEAPTAK